MGYNSAFKGLRNKYIEMHGQQNIYKKKSNARLFRASGLHLTCNIQMHFYAVIS